MPRKFQKERTRYSPVCKRDTSTVFHKPAELLSRFIVLFWPNIGAYQRNQEWESRYTVLTHFLYFTTGMQCRSLLISCYIFRLFVLVKLLAQYKKMKIKHPYIPSFSSYFLNPRSMQLDLLAACTLWRRTG